MDKEIGENLFLKWNTLSITMRLQALSYSLHVVMISVHGKALKTRRNVYK
jgi:hypothetical protein